MQRISADQIENLRRLRRSGMTYPEIRAETGVSVSATQRYCIDIPSEAMKEKNRKRVYEAPDWLPRAQGMVAAGLSRLEVARALKVPTSTLYRLIPAGQNNKKRVSGLTG